MEVTGQLQAPTALPPGKDPRYDLNWGLGGLQKQVRTFWRTQKESGSPLSVTKIKLEKDRTKRVFSCVYVYDAMELYGRVEVYLHSFLTSKLHADKLTYLNGFAQKFVSTCKSCWGVMPCSLASSSHRHGEIHQKTIIVFFVATSVCWLRRRVVS